MFSGYYELLGFLAPGKGHKFDNLWPNKTKWLNETYILMLNFTST